MKKQKRLSNSSFGKRFLSTVVSMAMAVTLMPALPAVQAEEAAPELLKAGAINATAETVTQEQPFKANTAGSYYFRIPALIVTKNGNLLAAADARYSTSGDGGGLDTIASVSKDGGKTWNYSFPLYFPDSAGYVGNIATTIIDPMLVQGEDGTIYCMADVNPTGVTTMGGYTQPKVGTGFITVDGKERLALTSNYSNANTLPTDDNTDVYEYYVGDWNEQGYAPVKNRTDGSDSQYAVDKWYNIYSVRDGQYVADLTQKQVNENSTTNIQQNAFYKDSKLHVYNTGYMMYAVSKDDGMTWGDPVITNPEIKRDDGSESALLVSPGQGLLMKDGTLVIPFYNHGDGEENSSIAWKDKDSDTWKRSNDVPGASAGGWWTSECEAVELDGMVRLFVRSGTGTVTYADAKRDASGNFVFSTPVNTGISCTSTCNVTAIKYSKKIEGKDAILVGMPGGSGRANGKIYTFLVNNDENKTLTLRNIYSVPNSSSCYAYSCMSELPDGTIGLLWENQGAAIRYDNFNLTQLVPTANLGEDVEVEVWSGETFTRTYSYEQEFTTGMTVEPDAEIAEVEIVRNPEVPSKHTVALMHSHIKNESKSLDSFAKNADPGLNLANAEFTLTASGEENCYNVLSETTGMYLTNNDTASTFFHNELKNTMKIVKTDANEDTFYISKSNGTRYVIFYEKNMDFNTNAALGDGGTEYKLTLLEKQDTVTESDPIPGYKKVSSVTSGKKYLISRIWNDGSVFVLYPTNGTANQTKMVGKAKEVVEPQTTTVSVTGAAEGTTTAVIDGITYNIKCKGMSLADMIKAAEVEAEKDIYTEDTLKVLKEKLENAKEIDTTDDDAVEEVRKDLSAALKGLVTKEFQEQKDNLDKIIGTDVGDLNSYTEATRTELNNAIAEANTLLNSGTATAAQLQAAYEKVDAALKGLVTQGKADADKAADTQLSAAEGVLNKKDDYTAESLAEIKKVYDEVQALKNDSKADPAAVTAAVERLKAAIAGLKKKDDTPAPVVIEQGKTYDAGDYYYKVTSTSKMTAEVTGLKNEDVKKLTINSTVKLGGKDYKVTSVAANAFKGNKKVTSITVKKGVTKIGSSAFASCTKVKKAVINSTTLKTIGAKAFSGCKNLKSITIKSKVLKKVGKNTFKGIHKKATIKVPKASLKKYKKLLKKGQAKTVKIK